MRGSAGTGAAASTGWRAWSTSRCRAARPRAASRSRLSRMRARRARSSAACTGSLAWHAQQAARCPAGATAVPDIPRASPRWLCTCQMLQILVKAHTGTAGPGSAARQLATDAVHHPLAAHTLSARAHTVQRGQVDLMHAVCEEPGCRTQPTFGWPGTRAMLRCRRHRLAGMAALKSAPCLAPGCTTHPSYAFAGEPPRYCKAHRLPGMVRTKLVHVICGKTPDTVTCMGLPCTSNDFACRTACSVPPESHFACRYTGRPG